MTTPHETQQRPWLQQVADDDNDRLTKGQRLLKAAEEALSDAMRRAYETGELAHLYGKPLDLSDTSPDWLATRILKRAGMSHPTLERGKDIDSAREEAEKRLQRVRRLHARLTSDKDYLSVQEVSAFNTLRDAAIQRYRDDMERVATQIRDWNLTVPDLLQRRPLQVAMLVEQIECEVPRLQIMVDDRRRREPKKLWWRRH